MRLFATQGYEQTTVADIAAAAEVAPRTVSLHFATKLDIALASTNAAMSRLADELANPDRSSDVTDTVIDWLRREVATTDADERAQRASMFRANPALRALTSLQSEEAVKVGIQALAAELGVSPEAPVVRTVLGAIVGAIQETELAPHVLGEGEEAFEALRTFLHSGLDALRAQVST
jgi:AcrR family transcriptional regulator